MTYYVSNDGNDSNDGLGATPDSAWQTISRVNEQSLQPGDAVLFKKGDVWREQLVIHASGRSDAYITYGAYGEGDRPRILGSERAIDWRAVDGHSNIWQSGNEFRIPESTGHNPHPSSIFFGELDGSTTWGRVQNTKRVSTCDAGFSQLREEYDWCWGNDAIYVYSPGNPSARYAFIEVPQRHSIIRTATHPPEEYITIDGLELMYAIQHGYDDGWPMNVEVRGLTIKNCHIAYMGVRGAASAMGLQIWHSDMLVQGNDIHDCGRRNISYNVYGDVRDKDLVFENVLFKDNTLHNGYHTTGFDISNGWTDTFRNFTFRNNFIYDDPADHPADGVNDFTSMGIYLHPGGTFTDFKIHNNILKNIKQKAFAIGGVHGLEIYNNVIYGMNPNIGSYRPMVSISGDYQNVRFNNNIVYGTVSREDFKVRGVYFGDGASGVASMANNIYYQRDPAQPIIYISSTEYGMPEWLVYQRATGWDLKSPEPQDPLFIDPANDDFRLKPHSPAIDAGLIIPGFNEGYQGKGPDIGAMESPYSK